MNWLHLYSVFSGFLFIKCLCSISSNRGIQVIALSYEAWLYKEYKNNLPFKLLWLKHASAPCDWSCSLSEVKMPLTPSTLNCSAFILASSSPCVRDTSQRNNLPQTRGTQKPQTWGDPGPTLLTYLWQGGGDLRDWVLLCGHCTWGGEGW